jgi:hypothetical protein
MAEDHRRPEPLEKIISLPSDVPLCSALATSLQASNPRVAGSNPAPR